VVARGIKRIVYADPALLFRKTHEPACLRAAERSFFHGRVRYEL